MNSFDAHTAGDKIKVARELTIQARNLIWAIDEGRTSDNVGATRTYTPDPKVIEAEDALTEAIASLAYLHMHLYPVPQDSTEPV